MTFSLIYLLPLTLKWSWDLNALSIGGDEFAISTGVDPAGFRRTVLVLSAFLTALVISFTGLIGFVGLAAPHMARVIVGNDFRKLIPSSAIFGAFLMLFADTLGRTLFCSNNNSSWRNAVRDRRTVFPVFIDSRQGEVMVMNDIIKVEDLGFGYPNKEVLKGINLTISNNELVCLLGINGAGKSTLLKCILGILKLQKGKISFDYAMQTDDDADVPNVMNSGNNIDTMALARYMSYVPQSVKSSFSIDVYDTIMLGRRPYIG